MVRMVLYRSRLYRGVVFREDQRSARRTPRDTTRRARRNPRRRAASSRASPGLSPGRRGEGPSPTDTRARNASRATCASPTDASALTSVCPRAPNPNPNRTETLHTKSHRSLLRFCGSFLFFRGASLRGRAPRSRARVVRGSRAARAPAGVARVCTSALRVAIRSRIGTGTRLFAASRRSRTVRRRSRRRRRVWRASRSDASRAGSAGCGWWPCGADAAGASPRRGTRRRARGAHPTTRRSA